MRLPVRVALVTSIAAILTGFGCSSANDGATNGGPETPIGGAASGGVDRGGETGGVGATAASGGVGTASSAGRPAVAGDGSIAGAGGGGEAGAADDGGAAGASGAVPTLVGISSRDSRSCVVDGAGRVWCWGAAVQDENHLVIADSKHAVRVPNIDDARQVVVGGAHACVLKSTNQVACWGENSDGQLGDGTNTASMEPKIVKKLSGVRSIAGGGSFTCALMENGTVNCWGLGTLGELGQGKSESSNEPVAVLGISNAVGLSAYALNACAITAAHTVMCWGADNNGQLGTAPRTDAVPPRSSKPVVIPGLTNVVSVALSQSHGCALDADGVVSCWSEFNESGQLGNGSTDGEPKAAPIADFTFRSSVFAGFAKTCAIDAASKLLCWGNTSFGPTGTPPGDLVPTPVANLGVATDVAIGSFFACAIEGGERVKCWGANDVGQLGNDSAESSATPVTVVGLPTSL